ncbi:hypothetical protein [Burkholderia pseudomultivorans]|uniref:hypothetical protein n=1 Tax=Burkholderia pseudomultivorans TaxID=1207504 RepID=UPI000A60D6C6|nr:hypothetical protein [Burkholderia pseudomultivorans]
MEHNEQELNNKVIRWLRETGFPLEMEAAAAFRNAGFDVRQSGTFRDPESNKGREIDVLASDPDLIGIIEISFIIECKATHKPWIVLTAPDAFSNFNRMTAFSVLSRDARKALASRLQAPPHKLRKYIERSNKGGYGLRQALGNGDDAAYTAAMSALKGCHDLALKTSNHFPTLTFAFPVIVVDAPLFECSRREDGEITINRVEESEFLFSAHIPERVDARISVVTREKLADFAAKMKALAHALRNEFKKEEDEALKRL